jgi:organic hydroperoxide reductase OsmC/OhrA
MPFEVLEKNAEESWQLDGVELRPKITWSENRRPVRKQLDKLHQSAHENCFIVNSVNTSVTVENRNGGL